MPIPKKMRDLMESMYGDVDIESKLLEILEKTPATERQKEVFRKAYGIKRDKVKIVNIARHYSVTDERIRQLKRSAVGYIARYLQNATAQKELEQRILVIGDKLNLTLEDLELSAKTYIVLSNNDIKTVRTLVQKTERNLLGLRNFGRKTLVEVKEKLEMLGLQLATGPSDNLQTQEENA